MHVKRTSITKLSFVLARRLVSTEHDYFESQHENKLLKEQQRATRRSQGRNENRVRERAAGQVRPLPRLLQQC